MLFKTEQHYLEQDNTIQNRKHFRNFFFTFLMCRAFYPVKHFSTNAPTECPHR